MMYLPCPAAEPFFPLLTQWWKLAISTTLSRAKNKKTSTEVLAFSEMGNQQVR
jgi:hypothetical protein